MRWSRPKGPDAQMDDLFYLKHAAQILMLHFIFEGIIL